LKIHWCSAALSLLLLSHSAGAAAQDNCKTIVKSAQDAASRADWVIEADLTDTVQFASLANRTEVLFENAKVVYEVEKAPRFISGAFNIDPCFPNAEATFSGKAGTKQFGKRMRFFGTKTMGRAKSFFFMQPASEPMPVMPAARPLFKTAQHTPHADKPGADGWRRAHSTEGKFSIEMPGPFDDITKGGGGEPGFMLRGMDQNGSTFMAVFQRSGPDSPTGMSFDGTIAEPGAKSFLFKGAQAVRSVDDMSTATKKMRMHALYLRVPGGTFMLGVIAEKQHEAAALQAQERFFNSLKFE
jgi:hypothetical protein